MGIDADVNSVAPSPAACRCSVRATTGSLSSQPRRHPIASCAAPRGLRQPGQPRRLARRHPRVRRGRSRPRVERVMELRRNPQRVGQVRRGPHDHDPRTGGRGLRQILLAERTRDPRGPEQDDALGERWVLRTMASARRSSRSTRQPDSGSARTGQPRRSPNVEDGRRIEPACGVVAPTIEHPTPAARGTAVAPERCSRVFALAGRLTDGPGAGGSGPGSPVRGSRNSRLRCTGPGPSCPVHRLGRRRGQPGASSCPGCCSGTGTPGEADQRRRRRRTGRPARWSAAPRCGAARAAGPRCRR